MMFPTLRAVSAFVPKFVTKTSGSYNRAATQILHPISSVRFMNAGAGDDSTAPVVAEATEEEKAAIKAAREERK